MSDILKPKETDTEGKSTTCTQNTSNEDDSAQKPGGVGRIEMSPRPNRNNETEDNTNSPKDPYEYLRTKVMIATLVVSLCAAIASAFSACGSWATLKANIARDQLDQRAWVGIVRGVEPVIQEGSPAKVSVWFKNSGKTPALNVVPLVNPGSFPNGQKFPIPPPYVTETNMQGKFIIQPGAQVKMVFEGSKLSQNEIGALKNGTRIGYVWGKVSYDDIFHNPHCAMFCLRIDASLTDASFCETYNDETNSDCKGK